MPENEERPLFYNVPLRNPIFTGHGDLLASLSLQFVRSHLVLLYGPGGMGKTQIALEYCYRSSTYTTILWLNASLRSMLFRDVNALADRLSLPTEGRMKEPYLFASFQHWLTTHSDWLLVLDFLDDFTWLKLILPPQPQGHILITTRQAPFGSSASSPVPPGLSESVFLLLQHAGFILDQNKPETPRLLSQTIQFHTIRTLGSSLTDAFAHVQQRQAAFSQTGTREASTAFEHEEANQLLFSFSRTVPVRLLVLLRLLAVFYPKAVPQEILLEAASLDIPDPLSSLLEDPLVLEQALSYLEAEELLSRQKDDRSMLHLHPGLKTVLITSLLPEEQRAWATIAVCLLNEVFPQVRFDTRATCERYLPLAHHCATLITTSQLTVKEAPLLLERLGFYWYQCASYAEAETAFTQALDLLEHHFPRERLDRAQTLNSLALLFTELARYREAEAVHLRALEIREQELGPDDPKTAESLHNLAMLYGDLGRYQQAEELGLRVLSLEERQKGPDHLDLASTLNNLGLIAYAQGHDTQAEEWYQRALTISAHSLPADHPDLTHPLDGLGSLAERQGKLDQAEAFYEQALVICRNAFGEHHPETAHCLSKLAGIAESRGNDLRAKALYEHALVIVEQTLGPDHPDVALFLNNLALLATKQGHYAQAEEGYQRALSIYEQTLGPEHPSAARVLHNQGQLFRKRGDLERAEALLRRALAVCEQALGPVHPEIALDLEDLATVLSEQGGADEEAEALMRRALSLHLQTRDLTHPKVLQMQERLATLQTRRETNQENGKEQFFEEKNDALS